ncbi:hypothetical protein [Microvirga pudoricolor]|uniref:hypothetical protein n=1 Tax=Microvirga pudoricolor TaxID=2778729 RepID=UPI00195025D1|nr:hypothetical protein [Microvirga pudoricolor]MBM6592942.1 hypothetical protein [Microvirga pudoricolor]
MMWTQFASWRVFVDPIRPSRRYRARGGRNVMKQDLDMTLPETGSERTGLTARLLIGGAVLCVVASGLLLWAAQGPVVFNDMVVSALAWCF